MLHYKFYIYFHNLLTKNQNSMKKIFLFLSVISLSLVISCKNEESTNSSSTTKEPNKNESAVLAINKAIESGNMAALDSLIAPNAVDHNGGPMAKQVVGLDSIKHSLQAMHNSMNNMKMDAEVQASEGDYVFTLTHMTGISSANPDPSMGMPPNTKIDMRSVEVVKFGSDGKATDHWGYMDPADMMKMTPPPPPPPSMHATVDTAKKMTDTVVKIKWKPVKKPHPMMADTSHKMPK